MDGFFKDLDGVCADINGEKITERNNYGATFLNFRFGNIIFINGSESGGLMTQVPEFAVKQVVFCLVTEKYGLNYFNNSKIGGDRTVGVYKAEEAKNKFEDLYNKGKISKDDWAFYSWKCDYERQSAIDNGY